ncbi:MAG: hypothetical protein E6Q50_02970 [Lysobacter sp.]|nr:MAG: hypothetical protein E6Q50_02970 [Lysobacter sp.]
MDIKSNHGQPLSSIESSMLVDLFMHWDTRVSQQETLYVAISVAPIAVLATTWNEADASLIAILSFASLSAYAFHLFIIRRIAVFQDNIFSELREKRFLDWDAIVSDQSRRIGVRRLRLLGLNMLSIIWSFSLFVKADQSVLRNISTMILAVTLIFPPLFIVIYLWRETPPVN